jgi:serine/threonine-protein kinase HipA
MCRSVRIIKEEEYERESPVFCALQSELKYRKIEDTELAALIERMDKRPLLIGVSEVRLTLAGAQQKIPLARFDRTWYFPLDGAPSTHILKPSKHPFPDLAVNEYLCMYIASLCGLPVPPIELIMLENIPVFVVERYDRDIVSVKPPRIERIHQEDICEALGIMTDRKYESDSDPGVRKCCFVDRYPDERTVIFQFKGTS